MQYILLPVVAPLERIKGFFLEKIVLSQVSICLFRCFCYVRITNKGAQNDKFLSKYIYIIEFFL